MKSRSIEISTARKHIYFYLFLMLVPLAVSNIKGVWEHLAPVQTESVAQIEDLKEVVKALY